MEIRVLSNNKDEGKLSFIIKDGTPAFANTLRRIITEEVQFKLKVLPAVIFSPARGLVVLITCAYVKGMA